MKIQCDFQKCILCLENSADSWEHIIPQFIGGKLQAKILCTACNNQIGSSLISTMKDDPSIRLLLEGIKKDFPDIYKNILKTPAFVGKSDDGSVIKIKIENDMPKIIQGKGSNDSFSIIWIACKKSK